MTTPQGVGGALVDAPSAAGGAVDGAAPATSVDGRQAAVHRVLLVSDVAAPRVNGVSTSIATFRDELEALGVEIRLVAPHYGAEREVQRDGRDWRVPGWRVPLDPEDRLMRRRPLLAAVREAADGAELIHVQTPFLAHWAGVRVARERSLPVVETHHTDFEAYGEHYLPLAPKLATRLLGRAVVRSRLDGVDCVVVPSRAIEAQMERYGVGARVARIPTGLALPGRDAGDGNRFRERVGIEPGRPTVVHVGRMAHEKNVGFLLAVHAALLRREPRALLVLAGEGPALSWLERRAERLGIAESVRFVGYLDRASALLDCYRAGDLFVFASRTETQGLVLLEAMALGVPVVSTAVGGTKDLLESGRGVVVVEEQVEGFAEACAALLRDPEGRRAVGAEGRAFVDQEWSAAASAERMLGLYRELVAGR